MNIIIDNMKWTTEHLVFLPPGVVCYNESEIVAEIVKTRKINFPSEIGGLVLFQVDIDYWLNQKYIKIFGIDSLDIGMTVKMRFVKCL